MVGKVIVLGGMCALAQASCAKTITNTGGGLELVLSTDLQLSDFDRMHLKVSRGTGPGAWSTLVDQDVVLPEAKARAMFSIEAGQAPGQQALIEATALRGEQILVGRVIELEVPTERIAELPVVLASVCIGKASACAPGESCQPETGVCGSNEIESSTLRTFVADAGVSVSESIPDVSIPDAAPASDAGPADPRGPGDHPSCEGLAPICGPHQDQDCCAANVVPGGTFNRSNETFALVDGGPSFPKYPATVSDFRLDNYEVTVGRYRRFLAAYSQKMIPVGAGKNPNDPTDPGWDATWYASMPVDAKAAMTELAYNHYQNPWTPEPGPNENRPVNRVYFYEAMAFCIWDGGRLPTEAEWNYAAAGGNEQRLYPWSDLPDSATWDPSYTSIPGPPDAAPGGGEGILEGGPPSATDLLPPVGARSPKGDGRWGQSDLAGSLREWTADREAEYVNPCINCSNRAGTNPWVLRPGQGSDLTTSRDSYSGVPERNGVRCARSP